MKEKQIFKYFVIGLAVTAVGILAMELYLGTGAAEPVSPPASLSKVEIDFSFLEDAALKALFPFEIITVPEGKVGRDNPFLPVE